MTENPIRIMSVDDHPLIRQGIAGLVSAHPDLRLVAEATNGREAVQQFRIAQARRHTDGPADAGNERAGCDQRDSRRVSRSPHHRAHHLCWGCAGASRRESGLPGPIF